MSEEDYDGNDARMCPFCGTPFSTEADTCLNSALNHIAELEAELARTWQAARRVAEVIADNITKELPER